MARSGSFGKLPKAAPDLSSTIAALLAEYMANVDQNMVDAWRNGGEVDGKPVTDGRLLAHFRKRRDELDPKDPEYQQWDNRILQYQFSIEESKMGVKWDNNQASEADMMAFYRKWEKKTPDNTEFDRSLRKSYGQWMKSSASRAAGSSAADKAAAHNRWANGVFKDDVEPAYAANEHLTGMLFNWGIIPGTQKDGSPLPPANIGGLEAFGMDDFETVVAMIQGGQLTADRQRDVDWATKQMKKIDPNFEWTLDWFNKAQSKADAGIDRLVKRSTTDAEANQWRGIGGNIAINTNRLNGAPIINDLKIARKTLDDELIASAGNPDAQMAAINTYLDTVRPALKVLDKPGAYKDPTSFDTGVVPGLNAEVDFLTRALNGETLVGALPPTWMDSTSGSAGEAGDDANSWQSILNVMNLNRKKIAEGGYAIASKQKDGSWALVYFDADQPPPLGLVRVGAYAGSGGAPVYTEPQPVNVVAVGPDGNPTGAAPIKTNASGAMVDNDGNVTTDIADAASGSDLLYRKVILPNSGGEPTSWYLVGLEDGTQVRTLEPPTNPENRGEQRTMIIDGEVQVVDTVTQSAADAGKRFYVSDYMAFGKATPTATAADGSRVTGGTVDPLRPDSPVTKDSRGMVATAEPGYYLTDEAANWASQLDKLTTYTPDYIEQRNEIMNSASRASERLRTDAFRAEERGDTEGAKTLWAQASSMDSDFKNLMILSVAKSNGDTSLTVGLIKAAESVEYSDAYWDGSSVVSKTNFGQDTKTNSASNMTNARNWALEQLDAYDATWRGTGKMGPAADEAFKGRFIPFGGMGGGASVPSTLIGATDQTYSNLRAQVEAASDPRLLKLPPGVSGNANPYLPTGLPPVTLATPPRSTVTAPAAGGARTTSGDFGDRVQGGSFGPPKPPKTTAPPPPAPVAPPPGTNLAPPVYKPKPGAYYKPRPYSRFGNSHL